MNYEQLMGLPILNGVTVIGNKRFEDYGLVPMSVDEIVALELEVFGYVL